MTASYLLGIAETLEAAAGITWDGDENMTDAGYLKRIEEASATLTTRAAEFPADPTEGQRVYRTDRDIEYFWDGTRWLSTQAFSVACPDRLGSETASSNLRAANPHLGTSLYIEQFTIGYYIVSGATAANYMTVQLRCRMTDGTTQDAGSALSTLNEALTAWKAKSSAAGTVVPATVAVFDAQVTVTGTTQTRMYASLTYRLVG